MYPPCCVDAVNVGHLIQGMQFLEMVTGGGPAREVMGHSQDAPHGQTQLERAPCGVCPLPGMGTMRHTGHAQHSLAFQLPFRIEV